MTARSEIEHRNLYYKRRASCAGFYGRSSEGLKERCASSATLEGDTPTSFDDNVASHFTSTSTPYGNRRVKSTSVCVGTLQLEGERRLPMAPPRTMNDFQFLNPTLLTMENYEVQIIRPPALSTSEIFNEPPPMYVYRVIPPHERKRRSQYSTSKPNIVMIKLRKHKHTLIAWIFGLLAVTLCTVVVVLQM